MANSTIKGYKSVHGTDPQNLVEKITRERIFESRYWKEECFALTAEILVDKAIVLTHIGGSYGQNIQATPFLCLVLKMLQLQPDKDIIVEFITQTEYKYARALGAVYMRLTGTSLDCYKYLEPLFCDYKKLKKRNPDGTFGVLHMDEFIDLLLREDMLFGLILPRMAKRQELEGRNELEPRTMMNDGLSDDDVEANDEDIEEEDDVVRKDNVSPRKERSRSRSGKRRRNHSRSKSRERNNEKSRDSRRSRSRHDSRDRRRRSKERRRDRDGDKDRSRERHRDRNENKSKERHRSRDRSRERKRNRDADRSKERHRDRSRERRREKQSDKSRHRSRSRDRKDNRHRPKRSPS